MNGWALENFTPGSADTFETDRKRSQNTEGGDGKPASAISAELYRISLSRLTDGFAGAEIDSKVVRDLIHTRTGQLNMVRAARGGLIGQIGGGISFGLLGVANVLHSNPIAAIVFFLLSLFVVMPVASKTVNEWASQNRISYVGIIAVGGFVGVLDWIVW
ncbi:hypothetical protein EXE46_16055 [Halorubrum sp. GN11_10-6_MGM]|uniref:hypothetical protein n=1 Tax=Halorubrum sp. GN11_10-6_MGM TaxID=2518112 RepID=UPI0010FA3A4C|nr:hypothetical protein [Halorubrum sp. GN11_10-6_MGM]TKX72243.1 hypothetical protein EXE46_16055 [Halorubrum sp. GN11_10-6_MGM]